METVFIPNDIVHALTPGAWEQRPAFSLYISGFSANAYCPWEWPEVRSCFPIRWKTRVIEVPLNWRLPADLDLPIHEEK